MPDRRPVQVPDFATPWAHSQLRTSQFKYAVTQMGSPRTEISPISWGVMCISK